MLHANASLWRLAMFDPECFLAEHRRLTRRWFLRLGAGGAAALALPPLLRGDELTPECARACAEALAKLEYFTPPDKFGDVSRGDPRPHSLPETKRKEVGLTQETWRLEVLADTGVDPATAKPVIENPLSKEKGNTLDW